MDEESSIESVTGVNVEEYVTVRPLHLMLTSTAGLLMTLVFYVIVGHKTKNGIGLVWKLISMIDITLCVSALAALFYQHVTNEKEYMRCVHVPLTTILSHCAIAAWLLFALAVVRTLIVFICALSDTVTVMEKAVEKAISGMTNRYRLLALTILITGFFPFVINSFLMHYEQMGVCTCVTDNEYVDLIISFAWAGSIITVLIFYKTHGPAQTDYAFYLEFSTHFVPLITVSYWLNGCMIKAGIHNMSAIVLALCTMFSTVSNHVTVPILTIVSTECTVPAGKETVIIVI